MYSDILATNRPVFMSSGRFYFIKARAQNETMRITDHRYARDVRRFNLALRLIALEARTHTVCHWTGLSNVRVRKLYQSYADADVSVARHRGPSPNQPTLFLRSQRIRNEAAALGGLLQMLKVLPAEPLVKERAMSAMERGERLCSAFELYRQLVPQGVLSLEHAVLLANSLTRDSELVLTHCGGCGCAVMTDRYGAIRRSCKHCHDHTSDRPVVSEAEMAAMLEPVLQHRLF